ncbi:MAG: PorT family protein [Cytophagales bacterium]|nr:PorT family protein [Cytophagales bacterium]
MKKYILLISVCLISTYALSKDLPPTYPAENRLGIKISPSISFNRVNTNPDTSSFSSSRSALRLIIGPIYDIYIKERYCLSTGLLYAAKRASIKNEKLQISEEHSLQYLQLPILFKLYTNEISLDTKLYFQLGGVFEVKIEERAAKINTSHSPFIKKFKPFDAATLLGVGVEYGISSGISVFGGISYQRGLVNTIKEQASEEGEQKVLFKNDFISIDIGARF